MAGWKRFALMGLMVALPVPMFAASGLAVPLPSVVYRAAIGVAERTQAVAVAVPGFEAVVAETTQVARRGAIRLSPEEMATRSAQPKAPASVGADPSRAARPRQSARPAGRVEVAPKSATHRPKLAGRAAVKDRRSMPVVAKLSVPEPHSKPHPHETRVRPEPKEKKHPAAPEERSERSHPSPSPPEEPKQAAPKQEPKGEHPPPPPPRSSPPPPALTPPPSLPPLPVTTPVDPAPAPVPAPLTPKAQLEEIAADLQEIAETRTVDRVAQALEKVESAVERLEKNPPDNQGAVGDIKNAVQKLDDARAEGEISLAERTLFVTRLKSVSTLLAA